MSFKGFLIISIKENSYRIHFGGMSKQDATNLMEKPNLSVKNQSI